MLLYSHEDGCIHVLNIQYALYNWFSLCYQYRSDTSLTFTTSSVNSSFSEMVRIWWMDFINYLGSWLFPEAEGEQARGAEAWMQSGCSLGRAFQSLALHCKLQEMAAQRRTAKLRNGVMQKSARGLDVFNTRGFQEHRHTYTQHTVLFLCIAHWLKVLKTSFKFLSLFFLDCFPLPLCIWCYVKAMWCNAAGHSTILRFIFGRQLWFIFDFN